MAIGLTLVTPDFPITTAVVSAAVAPLLAIGTVVGATARSSTETPGFTLADGDAVTVLRLVGGVVPADDFLVQRKRRGVGS